MQYVPLTEDILFMNSQIIYFETSKIYINCELWIKLLVYYILY